MKKVKIIGLVVLCLLLVGSFVGCSANSLPYPDWVFKDLKEEDAARAKDTDVRVMSANILAKSYSPDSPVPPRAQMFAEVLKHYTPDVVGLQEFDADWYKYLPKQVADDYTMFDTKKSEYTSMIYNHKTVKLIDQGFFRYSKHANINCRFIVWGVFEKLSNGKKFAVASTHWDFGMEPKKVEMKDTQAKEYSEEIDKIIAKYNVPVFATGDYNVFEKEEVENGALSFQLFMKLSQGIDSKYVKGVIRKSDAIPYSDESWDHIIIKGNVKPLLFNVLYNSFYEAISDHPLIYLDAKLG